MTGKGSQGSGFTADQLKDGTLQILNLAMMLDGATTLSHALEKRLLTLIKLHDNLSWVLL